MTLACAESCSGGMAAAGITSNAGASSYFCGGIVSYSNTAKIKILGVPQETIEHTGAVSSETAIAMAKGAQALFSADCSFSITGIAGPDGGTAETPVGTVWLAWCLGDLVQAELLHLDGDRDAIRYAATDRALSRLACLVNESIQLDKAQYTGVSFNEGK